MKFFEVLGQTLRDEWQRRDFDERSFPEIAHSCIERFKPSDNIDPLDVVRWVHETRDFTPQYLIGSNFGEPAITVFRHARFFIDVLFWVDGTTSVHQHGFSGAFHVLAGSSIHSEFAFREAHRWNDHLASGTITTKGVELLKAGDARPIYAGNRTIHSLFHLDRPSVSVVVRTPDDPFAGPQYAYARPNIAYHSFFTTEQLTRQLQTLNLLHEIGSPKYEEIAVELVRGSDTFAAYFQVSQIFRHVTAPDALARLLERVRDKHARLVELLLPVFDERRRQMNISMRRRQVTTPEHRFFLALLLNVPTREKLLELTRARVPSGAPKDTIERWVRELSDMRLAGDPSTNVLGITIDEGALSVFRAMLDGLSPPQVLERMKGEYSDEDVEAQRETILEMCSAFRTSLLFRPLFGTPTESD